jgi:hypothetical protein
MMDDKHGSVSQRAYAIWQEQGEPEGRDAEHWQQAEREIAGAGVEPVEGTPTATPSDVAPAKAKKKPARASKPA